MLNTEITEDLKKLRATRELTNHIQKTRKDAGINIEDSINIYYSVDGDEIKKIVESNISSIKKILRVPLINIKHMPNMIEMVYKDQYTTKVNGKVQTVDYILVKSHVIFDMKNIKKKLGNVRISELNKSIKEIIRRPYAEVNKELYEGELQIKIDNKEIKLQSGKDVFAKIEEYIKIKS